MEEIVKAQLGAACLALPRERSISAFGNVYRMPASELWFCSYGQPLALRFGQTDYLRFQFPHAGAGLTHIGNRAVEVAAAQGCVSSAPATLDFGPEFQQIVWRVNQAALARKLAVVTGASVARAIDFDPVLDLSLPRARPLLGILHSVVHTIGMSGTPNPLLLAELEQAMMVAMLQHGMHNYHHLLAVREGAPAPWVVRRLEEHIEAHLDTPFRMEDAVALTSCSARSIYRAFRQHRGYSPAEFSKRRRLMRAHELLGSTQPQRSVTDVAYACGFNDLSHFSRDFLTAFGVSPSAVQRPRRTR